MKTREEIAKELADKREHSQIVDEANELKSFLRSFLSDLKDFKVSHDHLYRLEDLKPLNELKNKIDSIPKEILIKKSTDKVSTTFLWCYFAVSSLVIALSLGFGIYQYQKYSDMAALENAYYEQGFQAGQLKGRKEIFIRLPDNSQNYLLQKYPKAFENIVK
jgi:hypothetical protein